MQAIAEAALNGELILSILEVEFAGGEPRRVHSRESSAYSSTRFGYTLLVKLTA